METEFDDSTQGTVTRLTQNLKDGQSQTSPQLWEIHFPRMVGMAREKLQDMHKRIADEEDVALSAFYSFYEGAADGRFTQLIDRKNLRPLLVSITAHKAVDLIRYHNRLKRGGTGHVASDTPVVDKAEKGAHGPTRTERRQAPRLSSSKKSSAWNQHRNLLHRSLTNFKHCSHDLRTTHCSQWRCESNKGSRTKKLLRNLTAFPKLSSVSCSSFELSGNAASTPLRSMILNRISHHEPV